MSGIVQVFLNVDLRNGHDGLTGIATKHLCDPRQLVCGEYLVFVNTAKNKLKIYAAGETVAYWRADEGKINMNVIREIPRVFNGGRMKYGDALKIAVEKQLASKSKDLVAVL